jgi:hypothetical protein
MRDVREVLKVLIRHVQPPKGCAIVLTERPIGSDSEPNWTATVGPMDVEHGRRFTKKVAELRKTDRRIDWSALPNVDGLRRIALQLSELLTEPV